jgi:hypothetical protein
MYFVMFTCSATNKLERYCCRCMASSANVNNNISKNAIMVTMRGPADGSQARPETWFFKN